MGRVEKGGLSGAISSHVPCGERAVTQLQWRYGILHCHSPLVKLGSSADNVGEGTHLNRLIPVNGFGDNSFGESRIQAEYKPNKSAGLDTMWSSAAEGVGESGNMLSSSTGATGTTPQQQVHEKIIACRKQKSTVGHHHRRIRRVLPPTAPAHSKSSPTSALSLHAPEGP